MRGHKQKILWFLTGILFFIYPVRIWSLPGPLAVPPPEDRILTEIENIPDSSEMRIWVITYFDAPIEKVWKVVTQYENFGSGSKFFGVTFVEPLGMNRTEMHFDANFPWPLNFLNGAVLFTEDKKNHQITWTHLWGFLKKNDGNLKLVEKQKKTILEFTTLIELGFYFPRWAVHWGVQTNVPTEIEGIRLALKSMN